MLETGYFLQHQNGSYIGNPEESKNWPAGTLKAEPGMLIICDTDGEKKSVDDLEDGQYCKILTLNTTHENYEWLYSSDKGS